MSKARVEDGLDPNRWRALAVIGISQLMVVLDGSIVNIAIPNAQQDLGISAANRQWIVTAYTLAFGSLLLLGGRIADFIGRKRAFMIGLAGFALRQTHVPSSSTTFRESNPAEAAPILSPIPVTRKDTCNATRL